MSIFTSKIRVPDLLATITTLQGETNYLSWKTSLRWTLDVHDRDLYRILTGDFPVPAVSNPSTEEERAACAAYERKSDFLLPILHACIAPAIQGTIHSADSAHAAFQMVKRSLEPKPDYTGYNILVKFLLLDYDAAVEDPLEFLNRWRKALSDCEETCGFAFSKEAVLLIVIRAILNRKTSPLIKQFTDSLSQEGNVNMSLAAGIVGFAEFMERHQNSEHN